MKKTPKKLRRIIKANLPKSENDQVNPNAAAAVKSRSNIKSIAAMLYKKNA